MLTVKGSITFGDETRSFSGKISGHSLMALSLGEGDFTVVQPHAVAPIEPRKGEEEAVSEDDESAGPGPWSAVVDGSAQQPERYDDDDDEEEEEEEEENEKPKPKAKVQNRFHKNPFCGFLKFFAAVDR